MSDFVKSELDKRKKAVFVKLNELDLDGFLVSSQPDIYYLTGFQSRDSYLLLTPKESFFITDFRYLHEARKSLSNLSIKIINGSLFKLVNKLCLSAKVTRLGFQAKNLLFGEYEKLSEQFQTKIRFIPTYDLIETLRQIKSPQEIKFIKKAVAITVGALNYAKKIIQPGMKEYELGLELKRFILERGAGAFSFDIIVASGPNSAFPHHITTKRIIKNHQPVLIDMGVEFKGYKSDLTRVFFLGKMTPVFSRIYNIVQRAQGDSIRGIRPGITISKIDSFARQYIAKEGYGRYFGHGLGHGIGLQVHESPHISSKNKNRLIPGMIFTIEPAIYLPGQFGIRLEDMVLVTKRGAQILSDGLD